MESLGTALSQAWPSSYASRAPSVNPIAVVLRNLIFLAIVLCHGFRRLGPPIPEDAGFTNENHYQRRRCPLRAR